MFPNAAAGELAEIGLLMLLLLLWLMLRLPLLVDAAAAAAVFATAAAEIYFAAVVDVNSTDAQHPHQ